ncbi:MAG: SDR family NAD(P)-dependent oxidoreductase [Nitrospiraceae bacterium]|nr:SDR family NAD(P)-dependent oxidoreductase [Nitrospiraceae bacterium]
MVKSCAQYIDNGAKLRAVFFAGGGAAYGYPEFSGYALSKVAVVRSVENLAMELVSKGVDASVIALAPGAVATDMLSKVVAHGGVIKTRTDISEPTNFVRRFLSDEFDSKALNGRFLHVRDSIGEIDFSGTNSNLFTHIPQFSMASLHEFK